MNELEITQEQKGSTTILHVQGAVDSNTAPELQQALLQAAELPGSLELDLVRVSFLSSAGLRALLAASKSLQKRGERLRLVNVPLPIQNVLNLTGFSTFIDVKS